MIAILLIRIPILANRKQNVRLPICLNVKVFIASRNGIFRSVLKGNRLSVFKSVLQQKQHTQSENPFSGIRQNRLQSACVKVLCKERSVVRPFRSSSLPGLVYVQ